MCRRSTTVSDPKVLQTPVDEAVTRANDLIARIDAAKGGAKMSNLTFN